MKRSSLRTAVTALLLTTSLLGTSAAQGPQGQAGEPSRTFARQSERQQGQQGPTRPPDEQQRDEDDEIVRINANLIQIDAVVTDERGRQVTNLTAEEFEILEDGKPREITHFSYINHAAPGSVASEGPTPPSVRTNVRPVRLRPEQLRRTIVFVIDDLTMSYDSAYQARRAMRRFVEEQMEPGDLVAVVRASAGVGALQQLTNDKAQLLTAVERVRSVSRCRSRLFDLTPTNDGSPALQAATEGSPEGDTDITGQVFANGVLGAINLVVRGLREVPGRKAVVLFSDGPPICNSEAVPGLNLDATVGGFGSAYGELMRRIVEQANRASVVFYSVDPRGLITLDSAAVGVSGSRNPAAIAERLRAASQLIFDTQNPWTELVRPTGGLAFYNTNDLPKAVQRVADDQKGYYLIGYRPDDSTFEPGKGRARFNSLKVRVRRAGLTVRSREGFYGLTDEQARPTRPRTRDEQLLAGLSSPFSATSGQIDVRLTSLFGNEPQGSFVLSMLHIDPRGLTFAEQPDGWRQAVIDLLAVTFDADGKIVESLNKTQTVRARGETLRRVMRNGLVYSLSVPAKKPGGYQLRIAVRDAASERVGSAGQFIEVPNIGKGRLTLSGITLDEAASAQTNAAGAEPQGSAPVGDAIAYDPQGSPALRRFRRDTVLEYGAAVYNPKRDKATGRPSLKTQVLIFRDGQQVFAGQPQTLAAGQVIDAQRAMVGGRLRLGSAFPPGEYVLQLVVTDELAGEKRRTATQWIDFEVVN